MFVGMSFCLPIAYFEQWQLKKKRKSPDPVEDPLLSLVGDPARPLATALNSIEISS